jgi:DNA-binding response OmpR family regulator
MQIKIAHCGRKIAHRGKKLSLKNKKFPLCAIFLARRGRIPTRPSVITGSILKSIAFEEDLGLKLIQY